MVENSDNLKSDVPVYFIEKDENYDPLQDKELIDCITFKYIDFACKQKEEINYKTLDREFIRDTTQNEVKRKHISKVLGLVKKHFTEYDIAEIRRLKYNKPLIVPPRLNSIVLDFEARYAISGDNPIMILGATGVGKSLFLYLAKRLFKEQHQYDLEPPPVVEANCAHFSSGDGTYSLARSELFGHAKGSFTGADKDKVGLVEVAKGGLLILEEVGELPFEVQAMFLTFIETGEYRRLGDEKLRRSKVKIVAATNRESELRNDFRYRFLPFYILPLHERKEDILYYFEALFPELYYKLTKSEVLLLLTHHWPGNVREIDRIGKLLMEERWLYEKLVESYPDCDESCSYDRIFYLDPKDTGFNPNILYELFIDLEKWKVDVTFLEKLLSPSLVSIDNHINEVAFDREKRKKEEEEEEEDLNYYDMYMLSYRDTDKQISKAYNGYILFCKLFLQDPNKPENILSSLKTGLPKPHEISSMPCFDFLNDHSTPRATLQKQIVKYLYEAKHAEHEDLDVALARSQSGGNDMQLKDALSVISDLREDELQKLYYKQQIQKTSGNIKAAARLIGLNENTFRSRLKKLGINYRE